MEYELRLLLFLYISATITVNRVTSLHLADISPSSIKSLQGANLTFVGSFDHFYSCACEDKSQCAATTSNGVILEGNCLHFEYGNGTALAKESIKAINSTALTLELRNAQPMSEMIKFFCNNCVLDAADVLVEPNLELQPVRDFSCRAYDFRGMNCSFSIQEYARCDFYSLSFGAKAGTTPDERGGTMSQCALKKLKNSPQCECNVNEEDYFPFLPYYNFDLVAKHREQQVRQAFRMNQIDTMLPATPEFHLVEKTSSEFLFRWEYKNGKHFERFKKKLIFNVSYCVEADERMTNSDFQRYSVNEYHNASFSVYEIEIFDLDYAYSNYHIRIAAATAEKNKTFGWSAPQEFKQKTAARTPDLAPVIPAGSFAIVSGSRLRLYWQPLEPYQENGENITYILKQVSLMADNRLLLEEKNVNSALFSGYRADQSYEFHIYASNHVGISKAFSSIVIENESNSPNFMPSHVRQTFLNPNRKILYEIKWTEPRNSTALESYMVFWCIAQEPVLTNACQNSRDGSIQYERVDKSRRSYRRLFESPDVIYNFGVSANFDRFSSAMAVAPCTAYKITRMPEIDITGIEATAQNITIHWNMQCVHRTLLELYDLTYCLGKRLDSEQEDCDPETKQLIQFKHQDENSFTIHNLQPYHKYWINMRMSSQSHTARYMKTSKGVQTLESAPSAPQNLKLVRLYDVSALIQWSPPQHPNGIIRSYLIRLHNATTNESIRQITVSHNSITVKDYNYKMQYEIVDLKPYIHYKVSVIANTLYTSEPTDDLIFRTNVGHPSTLERGHLTIENDFQIVTWNPPAQAGSSGISFYQVTVQVGDQSPVKSIVTSEQCTLQYSCDSIDRKSPITVKAVAYNEVPTEEVDLNLNDYNYNAFSSYCQTGAPIYAAAVAQFQCQESVINFETKFCASGIFLSSGEPTTIYEYFDCGVELALDLAMLSTLAISFLFLILMAILFYLFRKKVKLMKNVDYQLPFGLDLSPTSTISNSRKKANNILRMFGIKTKIKTETRSTVRQPDFESAEKNSKKNKLKTKFKFLNGFQKTETKGLEEELDVNTVEPLISVESDPKPSIACLEKQNESDMVTKSDSEYIDPIGQKLSHYWKNRTLLKTSTEEREKPEAIMASDVSEYVAVDTLELKKPEFFEMSNNPPSSYICATELAAIQNEKTRPTMGDAVFGYVSVNALENVSQSQLLRTKNPSKDYINASALSGLNNSGYVMSLPAVRHSINCSGDALKPNFAQSFGYVKPSSQILFENCYQCDTIRSSIPFSIKNKMEHLILKPYVSLSNIPLKSADSLKPTVSPAFNSIRNACSGPNLTCCNHNNTSQLTNKNKLNITHPADTEEYVICNLHNFRQIENTIQGKSVLMPADGYIAMDKLLQ